MLRRSAVFASLLTVCTGLLACGGDSIESAEDDLAGAKEGSPEALAVLALVNDRAVTVKELDIDAAIDGAAAKAIVARRDGADKAQRTADDNLFDTLNELDAVNRVGAKTYGQLLAYAKTKGYFDDQLAKEREVIFSPQAVENGHTARIKRLIDGAQSSIDIAMYSYSDAAIGSALQAAVARGIKVRFLFETAGEDKKLTGGALESSKSGQLEKKGVDVRYVNKILHHKFIIVDGPRDDAADAKTTWIASGSGNWSNSAVTRFDENTMFLHGYPEIALRMQGEFNLLWEHSRDLLSNPALTFEASTFPIDESVIPDDPGLHALFTSKNFIANGDSFTVTGANEVADALVAAIAGAEKSIHIASGHLRSRPVAEALIAKKASTPAIDLRVYLDGQEFISLTTHNIQVEDRKACLTAAGTSESKIRTCLDKGFLYGLAIEQGGADVRYKYYAYRWDHSYADQMHHKYMVIDGDELFTGSYNLSDNAEHNTFENMLVFKGPEFKDLVAEYEANFAAMWDTKRDALAPLRTQIDTASTIPIVFTPMALTWQEVSDLKALIRTECSKVDSTEFRQNAAGHKTCTK